MEAAMERRFNRTAEDLGNIVALEHVNITVPDQQQATIFYIAGLGLTRDPYLMTGPTNMWVNVGRSQFHLPTMSAQVLRGHTGIVVPDRAALVRRLERTRKRLEGTRFDFKEHVEFVVHKGAADGIARFYRNVMGAKAAASVNGSTRAARVEVGIGQYLTFRETDRELPSYDGHHIQIYVADFSGPYSKLLDKGLISEESDQHQYRFKDLADPETGETLFTLEHEVRSMRHPLFMRPLVNRNPSQSNLNYAMGYDAWIPGMPPQD